MPPLRDIRDYIPRTDHTNPNKFPDPGYQRYPLMAVNNKTNKPYLDAAGQPVIFNSREEEETFAKENEDLRNVQDPEDSVSELERLRQENAELKAKQSVAGPTPSVSAMEPIDDIAKGGAVSGLVHGAEASQEAPKTGAGEPSKPAPKPAAPKPGSRL
jgi:hypothetical protein